MRLPFYLLFYCFPLYICSSPFLKHSYTHTHSHSHTSTYMLFRSCESACLLACLIARLSGRLFVMISYRSWPINGRFCPSFKKIVERDSHEWRVGVCFWKHDGLASFANKHDDYCPRWITVRWFDDNYPSNREQSPPSETSIEPSR